MVVSLQPFSTGKRQLFETDEKIEIACVNLHIYRCVEDTKTSQKVKKTTFQRSESSGKEFALPSRGNVMSKNNSYNEEFDPGSG